jgi:beta-lactamase regulating signal transducer with metallopeptidase domain
MPGIVMAWFAGAAACSLRLLMGFISAAALRRSRHAPVLTEWQQTLDQLIERMHVSRIVRLLATDRVDSHSVIGWLHPVILAPVGVLMWARKAVSDERMWQAPFVAAQISDCQPIALAFSLD